MKRFTFGVSGHYKLRVLDAQGNLKREVSGKNVILNQGLDRWFATATGNVMSACQVGTGTSTPTELQTNLDSLVASTYTRSINSGSSGGTPEWYYFYECTYTFPLGGVVGNITELGVHNGSNLMTRALIKDELGDPTAIAVGATEQLIVIYELRKYPMVGDLNLTLTLNFNGTPTDYASVVRAANITNISFSLWDPGAALASGVGIGYVSAWEDTALGATTSRPSGNAVSGNLNAVGSYVPGTFYRDYTADFALTQGNFATGIGAIALFGSATARHMFQMNFTPKIDKNPDRILSIPVRLSWARI